MSVNVPSNPIEVQDFQFKLIGRLRVFTDQHFDYKGSYSLIACASKYGLVFVGCPIGIQVISLASILGGEHPVGGNEIANYCRREVHLPTYPTNLSVSCDQNYLTVVIKKDGCSHALIYNIPSFLSKAVSLINEVRLCTNPEAQVTEVSWNPGIPNILASCLSDGSLGVYEFKTTGVDINTLPPDSQSTCFSWSPKGKQLVVGSLNGSLTQYKPDLKAVKIFPAPQVFQNPAAVLNVLWISNYQFAAVYRDIVNETERPALLIVNAPKAGPVSYVNYEDICYSSGELRKQQFYLVHQANWNVMVVGSANSMEVGVLGLAGDQVSWEQWIQEDAARAELPLTADKEETYPLGLGFDTSTQHELPWGENQTIPPMPVLLLLSHRGVLCLFYAINLRPGVATLCSMPERVRDESGLALFTTTSTVQSAVTPVQNKAVSSSDWGTPAVAPDPARVSRVNLSEKFDSVSTPHTSSNPVSNLFKALPVETSKPMFSFNTPASSSTALLATPSQSSTGFTFPSTAFSAPTTVSKPPVQQPQSVLQSQQQQLLPPAGISSKSQMLFGDAVGSSINLATSNIHSFPTEEKVLHVYKPEAPAKPPPSTAEVEQKALSTEAPSTASALKRSRDGNSSVFQAAIINEMGLFEKELLDLKSRVMKLNVEVGTPEEKALLRQKADMMEAFCQELQETTVVQCGEVFALKGIQVEAFSWVEDAKSREQQVNNPRYLQLVQEQELDPVSARYLASIKHLVYYVGSQLDQVNESLDLQWMQFKDSCKEKVKGKMYVPSLEAVYQSMVNENNIVRKLRMDVDSMVNRVAQAKKSKSSRAAFKQCLDLSRSHIQDKGESELSQLAESLLQMKLGATESSNMEEVSELVAAGRCSTLIANNRKLDLRKQAKLRELLAEHSVGHVMPIKQVTRECSKLLARENPLSMLSSMVGNTASVDTPQTEHAEIIGQMAKSIFVKCDESTQSSGKLNLKPKSKEEITSEQRLLPSNVSSLTAGTSTSTGDAASKQVTNFNFGTSMSKSTSVASTNFSFSASPFTNVPMFGGGLAKAPLSSQTSFSFVSGAPTTQAAHNIPLFNPGNVKSTSNVDPEAFSQFSSLSVTTSTTPALTSTPIGNFIFGGSQLARPTLPASTFIQGTDDTSDKLSDANQGSTKAKGTSTVLGGGLLKNPQTPPIISFFFSLTSGSQTQTSTVVSTSSGSQTKPSVTQSLSQGEKNNESTPTQQIQIKTPALSSSFNFGSSSSTISSTPATTTTDTITTTQSTPSATSIFGGAGGTKSGSASGFDMEQLGVSLSPVVTSATEQQTSKLTSVNSPQSSVIKPSTVATSSTTTASTAFSFALTTSSPSPSVSSLFGDNQTSNIPVTAASSNTFFGQTICSPSSVEQKSGNTFGQKVSSDFGGTPSVTSSSSSTSTAPVFGTASAPTTTTVSTTPSLFGIGTPTSSSSTSQSIFGAVASSTQSLFGTSSSASPSLFGAAATSTTQSLFGTTTAAAGTPPSIFGGAATTAAGATTPSIFGGAATTATGGTTPSIFGGTAITTGGGITPSIFSGTSATTAAPGTPSLFGGAATTAAGGATPSIFGGSTAAASGTTPILFGGTTATTSASGTTSSLFGGTSTTAVSGTTPSVFGGTAATTVISGTTPSVFGGTAATTVTSGTTPSVFGGTAATTVTSGTTPSVFGGTAATTVTSGTTPSVFGGTAATTPSSVTAPTSGTTPSLFGGPAATTAASGTSSLFTEATTTTSAATPLFGTATTTTSSLFGVDATGATPSIFGGVATTAGAMPSLFGGTATTTATTTPSLFGATTTASSLFGGTAASTTVQPSMFGSPATTSSPFANTGTGSGSPAPLFGSMPTSSSQSLFATTPPTSASSPFFGQATTTSASVFGQSASSNVFGQAASNTGSSFFGGGTGRDAFASKPMFGQSGGSLFGQSTGTGFGSSGGSLFGRASTFGNQSSTFQSAASGNVFGGGSPQTSSTGGAFSSGGLGQSISQSGFGSPPSFQNKPGGFGGLPVFGQPGAAASSGFGAPPTFGGQPSFGNSPTFGSSGGAFGSSSPTQSSTFESLATQNTMTFGNLASSQPTSGFGFGGNQQPDSPPNQPTFTSTPSFGGSSFSSWR